MTNKENRSFLSKAREIGSQIREVAEKKSKALLICHFDTDGLAAGGIMAKALIRWGASIHIKIAKQLDKATLNTFKLIDRDAIVLSEIGSGYIGLIEEHLERNVFVLDHHPIVGVSRGKVKHLNPIEFGFDGAKELSGSGVNYFAVKEADARNIDLAYLAVVGALGDMQDRNKQRELIGLNRLIVEDSVKAGHLKIEKDLIFLGRETRPIHKALASTTSPFLPGLTGREDICLAFLSSTGIAVKDEEKWKTIASLTMDEKRQLLSKIVEYLTSQGFQGDLAQGLIGNVYTLTREEEGSIFRDAREFSSVLNACGRTGKPGLGLSICLGDSVTTIQELDNLVREYKQALAKHMEWVSQNPDRIQRLEALYIVRGEDFIDENLVGAIASMISASNILSKDKPIIVTSKPKEGVIKISARTSKSLVEGKLHLGELLSSL